MDTTIPIVAQGLHLPCIRDEGLTGTAIAKATGPQVMKVEVEVRVKTDTAAEANHRTMVDHQAER